MGLQTNTRCRITKNNQPERESRLTGFASVFAAQHLSQLEFDSQVTSLPEEASKVYVPLAPAIQKGTRVLISLLDSLMFGRVPGTRPNISESQVLEYPFVLRTGHG